MISAGVSAPVAGAGRGRRGTAVAVRLLVALLVAAALVVSPRSGTWAAGCATGQYLAEYYGNQTLEGAPAATGCEGPIDYTWWSRGPERGVGTVRFSARW